MHVMYIIITLISYLTMVLIATKMENNIASRSDILILIISTMLATIAQSNIIPG